MTILPEDDIVIDHRESCAIDEAVAKMLGWMRGLVRKRIIESDQYGRISGDNLSYLSGFRVFIKTDFIKQ